jgi:hypothetical protein
MRSFLLLATLALVASPAAAHDNADAVVRAENGTTIDNCVE